MTVPSVFVSYSHKDEKWKDRLLPHLRMFEQEDRLTIWEDRQIDAGSTWYDKLKAAMEAAEVAVCLISANYLSSDFCVKEEIPYFLKRRTDNGLLLLPILIDECLWEEIDWLKSIQMLPRDGKAIATHFRSNWNTPFKQVAKEIIVFSKKETREILAPPVPRWSPPEKVDVDRLPVTGAELFGRQNELKILNEAWDAGKLNVISFVAWGGVGKSTLINKWREQMAADNYRGAKRVFAWSFYSQGTGDRVTSADIFIAEALKWFGDPEMANSNASPWDKGQRLADLVKEQKTLLLLDGMEPLQSYFEFERGKIKDPALAVLVTELAKENPGLCVITTRENVFDLADFPDTTEQVNFEQISAEAGRAILRVGGVHGTDAELEEAARGFGLYALALSLLASYIHEIPGHHISNAKDIPDIDVPEKEGKHPRRVMSAFDKRFGDSAEVNVLRMLGLFSSPAEKEEIAAVREASAITNLTDRIQELSDVEWSQVVSKLRRLKLIAPESQHRLDTLDAHPLVREHFGKQLKQEYSYAWREGNNRLYEYYKTIAKEYPETIEEMAPLFAAVRHGCQAGKYQDAFLDVYWRRIGRKDYFNIRKLGAIGADLSVLSEFFVISWSQIIPALREDITGAILTAVGFSLRALGRLEDAAQPMKAGLEAYIAEDWENYAISMSNLSELYLSIGNIKEALAYAEQSVELADRSRDTSWQRAFRTTLANVLHQIGRLADAQDKFDEAEEIQKRNEPAYPYLYSLWGYHHCDLLLTRSNYAEVQRRASQTLAWVEQAQQDILSASLDNLSLGRAHLLQSQCEPSHPFTESLTYLNSAVDGLRRANDQEYIICGLLARTEYYRVTGDLKKAENDLAEAFTIARRGGMGLHLADCHLEYARLYLAYLRPERSEAQSKDISAMTPEQLIAKAREHWQIAKDSIEKMGYHRRDKEMQELEEQFK
jgi:tetratricopeptide (TPR) repeat protein